MTTTNPNALFRGLSTLRISASDLAAATDWYTKVIGHAPYFSRPGYVEFRLGDAQAELGIVDRAFLPIMGGHSDGGQPAGAVIYWHVDDVEAALARLIALGATAHEPLRTFGEGFVAASVVDPFGNVIGIMFNQHYVDMHTVAEAA